uniref:Pre-rRNA-processing protein RIX1 n=1 Tax=Kwoniella bestiolae CBS 10118 TaxID=1296100 RepID=A0A1B9G5E2_9TREE|nr:hypothetical protein I302_03924 [Kwoniella bestiolae CBS 10118]OCF26245.1 hypothetical protein I302_03924 [Kwoniella bestiolae CBS 10118]
MTSLLPLLTSLPFTHPSFLPLLQSHKPFAHPSHLPQSSLSKLLNRLNSTLLSRDDNTERRAASDIAKEIIEMDEEGYVMTSYGKGWVGTCLGFISSPSSPISNISPYLSLMSTLVVASSQYPSFEREVIHPMMGKLSVSLGKLFERSIADSRPEWDIILEQLSTLRRLIIHAPAPFRPLVPTLKLSLFNLILQIPTASNPYPSIPEEIRRSASDLVATLHVTAGKANSPQSWGMEIREALGGFGRAMSAITADAWEEEPIKAQPPNPPSALPELPVDPLGRLPIALDWAEGFTEVILALLRYPTARPVPVPIAQIHHAALLASLPRIWTIGVQLIGSVAIACGDHLFPHFGSILDHTVWLAERVPASMVDTQIQLLKFHHLLMTIFPPAIVPLEYPTRLLRLCLTRVQPLLENRSKADISTGNAVGGKRGKKRARNAEDGLVGGLEGREARTVGEGEVKVIVCALKLVPLLHPTPLLSPSLLTFSIRLHLSLYLSIPSLGGMLPSSSAQSELRESVYEVLEKAVLMTEGEGGTGRGWKSLIISVLDQHSESLATVLHPSLPPLMRPLPPLSQLHFFVKEGEEERKERIGMGFGVVDDQAEEEEEDMVVEQSISRVTVVSNDQIAQSTSATSATTAMVQPVIKTQMQTVTSIEKMVEPITTPANITPQIPPQPPITTTLQSQVSEVVSNFISQPSTSTTKTTQTEEKKDDLGDVVMLNDEDEEIPELDSGSDDFDEDEEEEEDEE